MGNTIYPCFWFDNNAADAAAFYQGIFDRAEIADENPFVILMHINIQFLFVHNF